MASAIEILNRLRANQPVASCHEDLHAQPLRECPATDERKALLETRAFPNVPLRSSGGRARRGKPNLAIVLKPNPAIVVE
jgi:hypothetical protein